MIGGLAGWVLHQDQLLQIDRGFDLCLKLMLFKAFMKTGYVRTISRQVYFKKKWDKNLTSIAKPG